MKKVWFSFKHTVDLFSSSLHLIWNGNTFFHSLYILIAICKEGHPTEYENKLKEFHLCRKCTKLKLREYLRFVWEFKSQEFKAEQKWVWQQFSNKYGINGGFTNFRIFQEKSNFLNVLSRVSINTYFPFNKPIIHPVQIIIQKFWDKCLSRIYTEKGMCSSNWEPNW